MTKDSIISYILHSIVILIIGGVAGVLLLTAAWAIPDSIVGKGVKDAENCFQKEGISEHEIQFYCYSYGSKLISDKPITDVTLNDDKSMSAIERAMSVNGYSRYWHGYMVFLRPLFAVFEYGQIRYIMTLTFLFLFALIFTKLQERTDKIISVMFMLSLGLINFLAVPFAVHAGIAFYVSFIGAYVVLYFYDQNRTSLWRWKFYLISGMCMSFIDLLTDPIIGLALPLLIELILDIYTDNGKDIRKQFIKCISASISWGLGYGLFWAEKWIYGSLILRRNILANASDQMKHWMSGDDTGVVWALQKNIFCLFPSGKGVAELLPFFIIYAIIIIVMIIIFIKWHNTWGRIKRLLPILFVSTYPYIWMIIMHKHSAIHATFWVFRTQVCAVFGVLSIYWMSLRKSVKSVSGDDKKN